MTNGTTASGFAYEFDPEKANDLHVLDHVVTMASDTASVLEKTKALLALPRMLLGEEQTKALYAHLAQLHDGRVPPAELERELTEILSGGGSAGKN